MKKQKPYEQMTAAELSIATREYDEPFLALRQSTPLTPALRAAHRRAAKQGRGRPRVGNGAAKLYISMERGLLKRADSFARKHGMSRSQLIADGLRAIIGSAA
jgi:hypothetical protein